MNSIRITKTVLLIACGLSLISFGYFLAGPRQVIIASPSGIAPANADTSPTKHRDKDPYQVNQVRNTILKNVLSFHGCYQDFLKILPKKSEGKIKMDWQITPDGQVRNPGVVFSTLGNSALEICLGEKLGALTFPPPPSGHATYAFHVFHLKRETPDQKPQLAMPMIFAK